MIPELILCADLHFRDDRPKCRIDKFWDTQIKKMKWLNKLQQSHNCPIICAGDYFHHWKPSPRLLSACIEYMPFVYTVPGNHDLPQHNLELIEKSGLWTLEKARKVRVLKTELKNIFNWGDSEKTGYTNFRNNKVAITHQLINHPQLDISARSILKKYKEYDLILSGDNHKTFTKKLGNRLLINPGSFTRQHADTSDHKPCVFLWYGKGLTPKPIYVPIEKDVISTAHLEQSKARDKRIGIFVERLNDDYELALSYENNLKLYFENNRTRNTVKQMVYESIEE